MIPLFSISSKLWLALGGLGFFILLLHGESLHYEFSSRDDKLTVLNNPLVTGSGEASIDDFLSTPNLGYPIPLTVFLMKMEYVIAGPKPIFFHAMNLLLLFLVSLMIFFLTRECGLTFENSSIASLFFIAHPAVSEPASWVTGQKDLLAAFFASVSILFLLRSLKFKSGSMFFASQIFGVASIFSKPVAIFLWPLQIFVFLRERIGIRNSLIKSIPLCFAAGLSIFISYIQEQVVGGLDQPISSMQWLREIWYALGYHLGLLFGFQWAGPVHPIDKPIPFDWKVDCFPLFASLIFFSIWKITKANRQKVFALGLAWAFFSYLPSSSLVSLKRYLADSYVLNSVIGSSLIFAALVQSILECRLSARMKLGLRAFIAVLLVTMSFASFEASSYWANDIRMWTHLAEVYPANKNLCGFSGNQLLESGKLQEALSVYENCSKKFGPESFDKMRGLNLHLLHREEEALVALRSAKSHGDNDPQLSEFIRRIEMELNSK